MEGWGTGIFECDEALDWLSSLEDATDRESFLDEAFSTALSAKYLDQEIVEQGVAAAEFLSFVCGQTGEAGMPEEAKECVGSYILAAGQITKAMELTSKILSATAANSELHDPEKWANEETMYEWLKVIGDLDSRLRKYTAP